MEAFGIKGFTFEILVLIGLVWISVY